jgi:hypothetical protein
MNAARWAIRVDELLAKGAAADASIRSGSMGTTSDTALTGEFRTASLSFLLQLYGAEHPYFKEFNLHATSGSGIKRGVGILRAVKDEIRGGWFQSVRGLISAELFSDFLEMADHLLEQDYKDAAAVIVGSTLEGHLRQLAVKHNIPTEVTKDGVPIAKKAETLNAELSKVAYEKQDNKSVTAWLNLRNDAAHGHYAKYQIEQVRLMLAGVRDFMTRIQA